MNQLKYLAAMALALELILAFIVIHNAIVFTTWADIVMLLLFVGVGSNYAWINVVDILKDYALAALACYTAWTLGDFWHVTLVVMFPAMLVVNGCMARLVQRALV